MWSMQINGCHLGRRVVTHNAKSDLPVAPSYIIIFNFFISIFYSSSFFGVRKFRSDYFAFDGKYAKWQIGTGVDFLAEFDDFARIFFGYEWHQYTMVVFFKFSLSILYYILKACRKHSSNERSTYTFL